MNAAGHTLRYRSDIDGLRAVAVLPVILYHFGSGLAPGGYVGVDVFFVISGFLITNVIRKEIEAGEFSLLRFYERRARRILPALFATCAATLAAALWLFMPDEVTDLGLSLIGVATFASNFLFWHQTDYFAGAVELKPLIHTWSLAVEEQYYIVFPLILMGVARWGRRRYLLPTLLLAITSFALSVAMMDWDASGNYYLLLTRAWELLIGSLLAYGAPFEVSRRAYAELVAAAGLALLVASVLLLNHESPFPGYNALWPTLGAAAIIAADTRTPTLVGRLLGTKPFVAVGLISYSLYLVHWPVIVLARYVLFRPPSVPEQVLLLVAMFVVAFLVWRFVERPFRNRHLFSQRQILIGAVIGLAATAAAGGVLVAGKGFPARFPGVEAFMVRNEDEPAGPTCFLRESWRDWAGDTCFLTRNGGPRILFWGDSHANHYRRAIRDLTPVPKATILFYGSAGCQPILNYTFPKRPNCAANNAHALELIRHYRIDTVVLSAYWYPLRVAGLGPRDVADTAARLRRLGVRVRIVGDNPDFPVANPQFVAYRLSQRADPGAPFYMPVRNDWTMNPKLERIVGPENFFDPMIRLCRGHECLIYDDGHPLMNDTAHLSRYGSARVIGDMARFLER
ncbi:acyltransferase family protein [Sphingomonas solaris]|uniref:acyltransferase family protein n=1 Tax=Alterirhizorhabdus solaris TaxID=2529389 RepID=UPI001396CAE3|nr:acyltransferase family protein [Sphingomonas solaris]